ncbi:MAG: ABC transporter ATP-binding protein [Prevotella sp.]|nr:ABC transporter ATP-binding protein [Prevotella sp.]
MSDTIRIEQLTIGYRRTARKTPVAVATGLNATLMPGRLTCLLGRNGIGKSTLLRTVTGYQRPLEGRVCIGNLNLHAVSKSRRARLVSVVLTEKTDTDRLTVAELVAMGRHPYTGFWGTLGDNDRQIVDRSMQLLGITGLSQRLIGNLSDGERQKVMIAKALAQQTDSIILDEPTAFLDYPSRIEMMEMLARLAREQQKNILVATHEWDLARQLSDQLWLMTSATNGQTVLETGTPEELRSTPMLQPFFTIGRQENADPCTKEM